MRKVMLAFVGVVLCVSAAGCAPQKFSNCTAMHKVYKGGVAKPGAHQVGMTQKYAPYVNLAAYNLNSGLDRDHDGVACEA